MADHPPILVLCRDLMFTSKISATANASAIAVKIVRDVIKLADESAGAVLVDLNQDGAIEAAASFKLSHPTARLVGFVSHVDTDRIAQARAAAFDAVHPRGGFVARLPEILKQLSEENDQ